MREERNSRKVWLQRETHLALLDLIFIRLKVSLSLFLSVSYFFCSLSLTFSVLSLTLGLILTFDSLHSFFRHFSFECVGV